MNEYGEDEEEEEEYIEQYYDDENMEQLTPDEEAELAELEARDWEKEFEKDDRMIQYWIHAQIRECKRGGMTRDTFYKRASKIQADMVRAKISTPQHAIGRLNEYMQVFDDEERI